MKTTIKIIGLLVFLTIIGVSMYAQKCEISKDPVTGVSVQKTNSFLITTSWSDSGIALEFNKQSEQYTINAIITLKGYLRDILDSTSDFIIKLKNENTLTLKPMQPISPTTLNQGYSSTYKPVFEVTPDQLKQLENSLVTFVRVIIAGKSYDFPIDEKYSKKIVKATKCILE